MCGIRQDINVVHVFALLIVRKTLIKSLKIHVKSNSAIESAFPSSYYRREGKDKPVKGDGIPRTQGKNMLGECFPSNVIESGAEGSFWHTGIAPYV